MSLDLAILGASGSPKKSISIDVSTHHAILGFAESQNLTFLRRLKDYYSDADYNPQEVTHLIAEVEEIMKKIEDIKIQKTTLQPLLELLKEAQRLDKGLVAISD
jgi:hypothetical protein